MHMHCIMTLLKVHIYTKDVFVYTYMHYNVSKCTVHIIMNLIALYGHYTER